MYFKEKLHLLFLIVLLNASGYGQSEIALNDIQVIGSHNSYKIAIENFNNAKTPGKKSIANKSLKRINACFEVLSLKK